MDNFKLNNWIVDVKSQRVRAQGTTQDDAIVLKKLVMDVLVFLSHRPGEIVTHAQLLDALWQDYGRRNEEVTKTVIQLSEALGDDVQSPQIIEIIDQTGFRLLVTPKPVAPLLFPDKPHVEPHVAIAEKSSKGPFGSLTAIVLMGVIGLALTFFGLLYYKKSPTMPGHNSSSIQTTSNIARLAVLPFENTSGNPEDDYLGDGIAEEVINNLSHLSSINVIAPTSSFAFKGSKLNYYTVGAQLNAQYLLKGSVKRNKSSLQVSVQLVSPVKDIEIWSHTYQRQYANLFDLQAQLTRDITKKLKLPANPSLVKNRLGNKKIQAYDLYLLGRFYANQQTATSLNKAIKLFNQAISNDPQFAQAYASLGETYLIQWQLSLISAQSATQKAQAALDKALQLSPNMAQVHASIGFIQAKLLGDQDKAILSYQEAIELKPNYAPPHLWLGILHQNKLEFNDARTYLSKALSLNPHHLMVNRYVGINLLSMGELDSGIDYLTRAIDGTSPSAQIEVSLARWYNNYGFQEKTSQWAKVAYAKEPQQHGSAIAMAFGATDNAMMHQWIDKAHLINPQESANFASTVNLFYYNGDFDALRNYTRQVLYTSQGDIDTSKPASWLLWAGIVNNSDNDYAQAISLLETSLETYQTRSTDPIKQMQVVNQLAYAYKKTGDTEKLKQMLKRGEVIQQWLLQKGLRTPFFVVEMVAYLIIKGDQQKAERLLRNAAAKGWKLDKYINNNPIFELLPSREQFVGS